MPIEHIALPCDPQTYISLIFRGNDFSAISMTGKPTSRGYAFEAQMRHLGDPAEAVIRSTDWACQRNYQARYLLAGRCEEGDIDPTTILAMTLQQPPSRQKGVLITNRKSIEAALQFIAAERMGNRVHMRTTSS